MKLKTNFPLQTKKYLFPTNKINNMRITRHFQKIIPYKTSFRDNKIFIFIFYNDIDVGKNVQV